MEVISRDKCILNDTNDLEFLYSFKNYPVFMGCTSQELSSDIFFDMDWYISKSSGLIQLKNLLPFDVLYPQTHGAGSIGKLWNQHHTSFANFLHKFKPKSVFEIGGSHGILNNKYSKLDVVPWVIVDANPNPIDNCNATFIEDIFDEDFEYEGDYDVLIHSHLFEHLYDPLKFMEKISSMLSNNKKMIFSIPNMDIMLDRKYSNCLNFEHTFFVTEPYIEFILSKYGFEIIDKEYFMEDHSIFYAVIKTESINQKNIDSSLYLKNKTQYINYINYYQNLVSKINSEIEDKDNVYLFGAHIFAQNLLSFGLNQSKIKFILDNDIGKHDKRLYGSDLFVKSPKILKDICNPVVVLNAGVYNNEIKKDIIDNINSSSIFI
jgi:SAM-dependent methyltransferase